MPLALIAEKSVLRACKKTDLRFALLSRLAEPHFFLAVRDVLNCLLEDLPNPGIRTMSHRAKEVDGPWPHPA